MNNIDHSITIFTAQDADYFFQRYQEKANSLEGFLLENDPSSLINNLKTQSIIIGNSQQTIFATVNHKEYNNTHICSPYNIYIGYGKITAKQFSSLWVRTFIYGFAATFGGLFKLLQFDKVIQLNNTLSTINLHPKNVTSSFQHMIDALIKKYSRHAIIWPRLNPLLDKQLYSFLENYGFTLIPTKIVHIYNIKDNYMKRSHTKRDLSLLKKSNYTITYHNDLNEQDIKRIHQLYEMLFIKKHSTHNPDLTLKYFLNCHRSRWFEFTALRNQEGEIDAFISQTKMNGMMICGPLGYDTEKPIKLGLYRMIIGLSLDNAHQAKCIYNLGSGNELFKLNRGSIRQLEYNAVYYKHLPFYRRIPWKILYLSCKQFSKRVFKNHLL